MNRTKVKKCTKNEPYIKCVICKIGNEIVTKEEVIKMLEQENERQTKLYESFIKQKEVYPPR